MSWFQRLKAGLQRSSNRLVDGINRVLGRKRIDATTLAELEDALIEADLGPAVAHRLCERLRARKLEAQAGADGDAVRRALADEIAQILAPVAQPFAPRPENRPHVVLVVGVNGSGKTTTIGKLAHQLASAGKKVMIAAGDTFRAAAIEQLQIWGERARVPVIAGPERSDPAALAFTALERAKAEGVDVLLIDTAGRLHNKADLMAELQKIVRVLRKLDPSAPHDTLLVLDATIGQNALQQVETFKSLVAVNGLVVTKLDGSARGGVVVAIAEKFALRVAAIGVGEGIADLSAFTPEEFARGLLDLDPQPTVA
jgi:fused signal recognition particle receptor